jgi:mannitol-1-phosphate 5-dehydrogenase
MGKGTFVGFGFGPIQAGLFLYEAWRSGNFDRLVVAEVSPELVRAVNQNGGRFGLNVAAPAGIVRHNVEGVQLLDPRMPDSREALIDAVAGAREIATALPDVSCYGRGAPGDVCDILRQGLERKALQHGPAAVVYTAENHNHAAEMLQAKLLAMGLPAHGPCQCLNTVVGKMSGTVTDALQIREQGLTPVTPSMMRAFLVEEFSRILITRIRLPGFERGIRAFEEKDDLLPFEEAKLYGHNAAHALMGYLLKARARVWMSEAVHDPDVLQLTREAFKEESGAALCRRYGGMDPLFTAAGFSDYVEDLLARMMNPHLRDQVDRVTRDPQRKLGWDDRLVGTMRLALRQGLEPWRYACGAAAAARCLPADGRQSLEEGLMAIWGAAPDAEKQAVWGRIAQALRR